MMMMKQETHDRILSELVQSEGGLVSLPRLAELDKQAQRMAVDAYEGQYLHPSEVVPS